jgi:hypothetical protein
MDLQQLQNSQTNMNDFSYREKHAHKHDIAQRVIEGAGSFLVSTLAIRFILSLLGANPANGFASLVYSFTAPFTAPFYNLFSYDHPTVGISTFEGYTLVAIGVYILIAAALSRLICITRY